MRAPDVASNAEFLLIGRAVADEGPPTPEITPAAPEAPPERPEEAPLAPEPHPERPQEAPYMPEPAPERPDEMEMPGRFDGRDVGEERLI